VRLAGEVEQDRVQAPLTSLGDDVGGCPGALAELPGTTPGRHGAAFHGGDDLIGDRRSAHTN
jgi:hypothetical protein